MKIRQPIHYPIIQQFPSPIQQVSFASPNQRFSQGVRISSPNSFENNTQRLRITCSIQQSSNMTKIVQGSPQHIINKKPHIKMPQQGVSQQSQSCSYDSQMMVGLIKENQEIKAKIIEKEKQLLLLQQQIALYEQQS